MFFNGSVVITQTCRTPRLWSHFRFCFFYFFSYSPCHRHLLKTLCRFIVRPFTHKELFLLHCLFSGSLFRCCSPELLAAKSGCFSIQHKLVRSHYNVLRKCTHTHTRTLTWIHCHFDFHCCESSVGQAWNHICLSKTLQNDQVKFSFCYHGATVGWCY